MQLSIGEKLGPYEIAALTGTGAMGEVYRARDTRLQRTIAIKIVRPELAAQDEFSSRFQREARAISAMNHPHVCSLYDIGEQNGVHYLVMEFVDGESLDQILKRGPLALDLALRYGSEIAEALAAAHSRGIIHRDLKPANIMISEGGVKVLDFGLAKHFEPEEASASTTVSRTSPSSGRMVGTVAYMSPEQAEGRPIDARTDVFALGVTLYQMLCGRLPFRGDSTLSTLASILRESPKPPRELRSDIPVGLERIVLRCLAKKPEDRYGSANDVARDLEQLRNSAPAGITLRRPVVVALAIALAIVVAVLGTRSYVKASRANTAETVTIPLASQRYEKSRPLAALKLLRDAEQYVPFSPALIRLKEDIVVLPTTIKTTPEGAEIYATDYADPEAADLAHWTHLGRSNLISDQLPRDSFFRIRIVKEGYAPVEVTTPPNRALDVLLHTEKETPTGMVWIPDNAQTTFLQVLGVSLPGGIRIPGAWLDRYEITNRQFKEFVDAGGYQNSRFWIEPFVKDGKVVDPIEAMKSFRDATGKPGPKTWEGNYPDGAADFPVGGVSWYEASAYAEYAGKKLPTVYHWYLAAGIGITSQIIPWSNFDLKGPRPIGSTLGMGPYGNYEMAGNVKEWTMNSHRNERLILGGGWNEPSYMFQQGDARSPWDRDATFGFRCAFYDDPLSKELTGEVEQKVRNRTGEPPVDDKTFESFKRLLIHDDIDLDVRKGQIIDAPHWSREDMSFQASYGKDRVTAYLFKPKDVAPPYQTVFFSAGGNMRFAKTPEEVWTRLTEWIVKSGRAVVIPAYAGTLDRGPTRQPVAAVRERELQIQSLMDISRTIDYLQTRKDFDTSNIAFAGVSFGSGLGLRAVTVEPRFKAAVLLSLGYTPDGGLKEVDSWNYAPRARVPILMLSGEDDSMAPIATSQLPMFNALGSPIKVYKHFPGGHVDFIIREEVIKEALDWLDKYLAPVNVRH